MLGTRFAFHQAPNDRHRSRENVGKFLFLKESASAAPKLSLALAGHSRVPSKASLSDDPI